MINISKKLILNICLPILAFSVLFFSYFNISKKLGVSDEEITDFTNAVAMNNNEPFNPSFKIFNRFFVCITTPYQGALKAWIVAPLIKIFGTSVYSMRFLNIVFAMVYLFCLYWSLKPVVGEKMALIAFLSPVLDTKFLLYAPSDFGPLIFQMIFIALSLGSIFRFIKSGNIRWCFLGNFMIGFVLAQKITSIPIFFVLLLINNLFFLKIRIKNLVSFRVIKEIIISIVFVLIPLSPHLYYFYKFGLGDFFAMSASQEQIDFYTYWPKLKYIFTYFLSSFDGVYLVKGSTLINKIDSLGSIFGYSSLITIIIGSSLVFYKKVKNSYFKIISLIFWLGLLFFVLVRGLNRPHHYFVLHPLWIFLFIVSFAVIFQYLVKKHKNTWTLFIIFIFVPSILMAINSFILISQINKYGGVALSSISIYSVVQELKRLDAKEIYGLNFSTSSPIYVLSNGSIKTNNLTWTPLGADNLTRLIKEMKTKQGAYIIARRSINYDWSKDWMDYLNRDAEIGDLIKNPKKFDVKITSLTDKRGTSFYIIK